MNHNLHRARLIEAIHNSDLRLSIALTGGGSGLVSELLSYPGASQTVLGASIPYSRDSLTSFLGGTPENFCSPETSQLMAVQAYFNEFRPEGPEITAVGGSAALVSQAPKKGDHRFFKSIQTRNGTQLTKVILEKNARSRHEEESLLVEIGLSELARLIGHTYDPKGLSSRDLIERTEFQASPDWSAVFHGSRELCCANFSSLKNGAPTKAASSGILAGSFNPLHAGHCTMAAYAEKHLGIDVHFELAIKNADKPPIDFLTIKNRVDQFENQPVWLTRAATFVEKSRLFRNSIFVVGLDTIERIGNPGYYDGDKGLLEAIDEIRENGCRFLVFGRFDGSRFLTLADVNLPDDLLKLCEEIPEIEFRNDLSSTMIRASTQF